ncbi:MAG: hypothetical protein ACXU8A_11550 [Burkholderiaceae bacterium]
MPSFFDENDLTAEQRARYEWAVAEYTRIQEENRLRLEQAGEKASSHQIGPQSALFARLLEGKAALPYPPPTSYSYPWYDIIEKPGPHHVSIGGGVSVAGIAHWDGGIGTDEHIVLNQCSWSIVHKNDGAIKFQEFLQLAHAHVNDPETAIEIVEQILATKPEYTVTYGQWGHFTLSLGRIVRRGRRASVVNSRFDLATLDGGNPVIVRVLQSGADMRAKSDAALNAAQSKFDLAKHSATAMDRILVASESAIQRSENPEDDDLVEFDCDGWVLEKIM